MKTIQVLLLLVLPFYSFSQNCKNFFTGQLEPIEQLKDDSIFYLFTLSKCHELHTNKGYRNVFNLKWFDHCSFEMIFYDTSDEVESPYKENEKFICTIIYLNDSILKFEMKDTTVLLKKYSEKSIWKLMSERDNELRKAEEEQKKLLAEYEKLIESGDSLAVMLGMLQNMTKNIENNFDFSTYELEAISLLFELLKSYDSKKFYLNCSREFQEQVDYESLNQYFTYISNVYGVWESFSVQSQSMNRTLLGIPISEAGLSKYSFSVKYKNCQEEVILSLSLSNENDKEESFEGENNAYTVIEGPKTFQAIKIGSNEYESSDYLENITKAFFEEFYKKNYFLIYKNSSEIFKRTTTSEQFENILSLAQSMREEAKYKFYKHAFQMNKEHGGLIIIHYIAENKKRNIYLSLTYAYKNGSYELAGLNIQEMKKK